MSYPEPVYRGEAGEISARVRRADATPELLNPAGSCSYLATGASTHGLFGLYRWDMDGPPTGPGPHFHRGLAESFFVLSGAMRLYDGNGWVDAGPGDYLYVPEGGVHGFRNESGEPASMLILFAPGAPRERFFLELAEIGAAGRELSDGEWAEVYARHDQTMA